MSTQVAAPLDPTALEAILEPFGEAVGLPAEAYTSPEVFAWERERFLDASWVCLGRVGSAGAEANPDETVWRAWRFANRSGDAPPLAEQLGNLDEELAPYEPERLVVGATERYELRCNWKLVVENYLECYHCSEIHPELCRVTPPDSGWPVYPTGLFVAGPMELMDHAETMSLDGRSDGIPLRGLSREHLRIVGYFAVWPNLLISPHPDYVLTHRLEPLAPDRVLVECEWLFPPELVERDGFDPAWAVEFWDVTNREDWAACESLQRGVESRGYRPGPLAPAWEGGNYMFTTMLARGYRDGRVREVSPVPVRPGA